MPPPQRELITEYSSLSKESGKYVYSIDNSRFTNHSIHNNVDLIKVVGEAEKRGIANRDIEKVEEILVNYRKFDAYSEKSNEEYLGK